MLSFKNKVILITGAEKGIGEAYAKSYQKQGGKVIIVGINDKKGEKVAAEIRDNNGESIYINTDITDAAKVCRCFNQ